MGKCIKGTDKSSEQINIYIGGGREKHGKSERHVCDSLVIFFFIILKNDPEHSSM